MKKIFLLFYFFCSLSFADTSTNPYIFIFHINGVNADAAKAEKNKENLMEIASIKSNIIKWDVIYNPSHGLLESDLWDVFRQKKQEQKDLTIDDYVLAYMRVNKLDYAVNSAEYQALKGDLKNFYAKDSSFVGINFSTVLDEFHHKVPEQVKSAVDYLKSYQNTRNAFVLLVPHSQGNLYANQLRNYLINAEGFPGDNIATFGIATPTDKIEDIFREVAILPGENPEANNQYLTADNDFVIKSLRVFSFFSPFSNSPLPANVHLSTCNDDNLCHELKGAYLADANAAFIIAKRINEYVYFFVEWQVLSTLGKDLTLFYSDNVIDHNVVNLLGPDRKDICENGECYEDIFGYIDYNNNFFSPMYISFPGKLSPGVYTLYETDASRAPVDAAFFSNGLVDAYQYYYRDDPHGPPLSISSQYLKIEIPGWGASAHFNNSLMIMPVNYRGYCKKFPYVCDSGEHLIIGRFTLLNPVVEKSKTSSVEEIKKVFSTLRKPIAATTKNIPKELNDSPIIQKNVGY